MISPTCREQRVRRQPATRLYHQRRPQSHWCFGSQLPAQHRCMHACYMLKLQAGRAATRQFTSPASPRLYSIGDDLITARANGVCKHGRRRWRGRAQRSLTKHSHHCAGGQKIQRSDAGDVVSKAAEVSGRCAHAFQRRFRRSIMSMVLWVRMGRGACNNQCNQASACLQRRPFPRTS